MAIIRSVAASAALLLVGLTVVGGAILHLA